MTVIKFEVRLIELLCHAIFFIPVKGEKIRQFIEGLTYSISIAMARESKIRSTFHQVVEIAEDRGYL